MESLSLKSLALEEKSLRLYSSFVWLLKMILWLPHSVLGDIMGEVTGTWEHLVLKRQNIVIFTLWLNCHVMLKPFYVF